MKLPKTITIDAKQYKAAIKQLYGKGRARDQFDRIYRNAITEVDFIVRKLSTGYQFIDGKGLAPGWIKPKEETKP